MPTAPALMEQAIPSPTTVVALTTRPAERPPPHTPTDMPTIPVRIQPRDDTISSYDPVQYYSTKPEYYACAEGTCTNRTTDDSPDDQAGFNDTNSNVSDIRKPYACVDDTCNNGTNFPSSEDTIDYYDTPSNISSNGELLNRANNN